MAAVFRQVSAAAARAPGAGDDVPRERGAAAVAAALGLGSGSGSGGYGFGSQAESSGHSPYLDFVVAMSRRQAGEHRSRVSHAVNRKLLETWVLVLVRLRGCREAAPKLPAEVAGHVVGFLGDAWEVVPVHAASVRAVMESARERRLQELNAYVEGFLTDVVRFNILPCALQGKDQAWWRTPASVLEQVARLNDTTMTPSAIIESKLKVLGYVISDWVSDGEGMTWTVTWS